MAFAPPPAEATFNVSDIVLHAVAFSVLTFGVLTAYLYDRWRLAVVVMLAYGIAIELVQLGLPTRSAEVKDVLVDLAGIGLGLGLFAIGGRWFAQFVGRILG